MAEDHIDPIAALEFRVRTLEAQVANLLKQPPPHHPPLKWKTKELTHRSDTTPKKVYQAGIKG